MSRRFGLNGATTGPANIITDLRAAQEAGYAGVELRESKLQQYLSSEGSLYSFRKLLADEGPSTVSRTICSASLSSCMASGSPSSSALSSSARSPRKIMASPTLTAIGEPEEKRFGSEEEATLPPEGGSHRVEFSR